MRPIIAVFWIGPIEAEPKAKAKLGRLCALVLFKKRHGMLNLIVGYSVQFIEYSFNILFVKLHTYIYTDIANSYRYIDRFDIWYREWLTDLFGSNIDCDIVLGQSVASRYLSEQHLSNMDKKKVRFEVYFLPV